MSEQLFKALNRVPWKTVYETVHPPLGTRMFVARTVGGLNITLGLPSAPKPSSDWKAEIVAAYRDTIQREVTARLEQLGTAHHLLNVYANLIDDTNLVELVFVFNDRDTALMMKLALA